MLRVWCLCEDEFGRRPSGHAVSMKGVVMVILIMIILQLPDHTHCHTPAYPPFLSSFLSFPLAPDTRHRLANGLAFPWFRRQSYQQPLRQPYQQPLAQTAFCALDARELSADAALVIYPGAGWPECASGRVGVGIIHSIHSLLRWCPPSRRQGRDPCFCSVFLPVGPP